MSAPTDPRIFALASALAAILTPATVGNDELLPLAEASRVAATSVRTLREAIRSGDLAAYGRQRDRAVRRGDLLRWVEARRVPSDPPDEETARAIDRRIARLRAGKARAAAAPVASVTRITPRRAG